MGKNKKSTKVSERIKAANKSILELPEVVKNRILSKTTKLNMYRAANRPVMTYAAETKC